MVPSYWGQGGSQQTVWWAKSGWIQDKITSVKTGMVSSLAIGLLQGNEGGCCSRRIDHEAAGSKMKDANPGPAERGHGPINIQRNNHEQS